MAYRTATFDGQADFASRGVARGNSRRIVRGIGKQLVLGLAAAATVGAVGAAVTLSAIWFVGSAGMTNPYSQTKITGPGTLSLAGFDRAATGSFETAWVQGPQIAGSRLIVAVPESTPKPVLAAKVVPIEVAKLEAPAGYAATPIVPLPPMRPVVPQQELARAPAPQPAHPLAPQLAALAPAQLPAAVEKRVAPQLTPQVTPSAPMGALPDSVSRTAVYDITNGVVFLPNGQKLEAHSGLYDKMDDPRHIKVPMRGPTPPNVYVLTEREQLFHGVRAIRLNPVDRSKMYGRDGMLAHTYMLGPNGQSNGCVSFKNYDKFLEAFLDGHVDKLVVVADLGKTPWRAAAMQADGVNVPPRRYASAGNRGRRYPAFFGGDDQSDNSRMSYAPNNSSAGTW